MKFKAIILTILLIIFISSAWGFNGERKGFVFGGGLGYAPLIKTSPELHGDQNSGLGLNSLVGYAWDDQNMIVFEGNVSAFAQKDSNLTIAQGFYGAAWYHYFGTAGKSAFTTAGIGLYMYRVDETTDQNDMGNDMGLAILLGGGYEFARHWQIGAYFSFGKTSEGPYDYNHSNLNLLISTVAF